MIHYKEQIVHTTTYQGMPELQHLSMPTDKIIYSIFHDIYKFLIQLYSTILASKYQIIEG